MSTVQPTYVNHAHLPGTSRVPSNIEEVLAAALAELAGKIDKNKAMHHGASEFSEENTYPAGIFVWYTDTSVPENSGLYICKEDVTVPGPWTGSANWTSMNSVSNLFTRDDASGAVQNSALEGAIDYNLTGSGQSPMNRSVTVLDATSTGVTITLPTIGVGITDLEYWVVMGSETQSVSVPSSVQWKDGKAPVASDYKANSTHIFHFTAKKPDAATTEVITGVMGVFATPA